MLDNQNPDYSLHDIPIISNRTVTNISHWFKYSRIQKKIPSQLGLFLCSSYLVDSEGIDTVATQQYAYKACKHS